MTSDYFSRTQFRERETIISTTAYYTDRKSQYTGLTVNESNESQILNEIFRQLPFQLPPPDSAILNPTLRRTNSGWVNGDIAYIDTCDAFYLPFKSSVYNNLYTCGYHCGESNYPFNSFESAVQNAEQLLSQCFHFNITVKNNVTVNQIILLLIVMALLV